MTQFLPPNLLALFAPRDPIPFMQPLDKLPWEKKSQEYTGVTGFLEDFEDPKDTPPPTRVETKDERKERKRKERAEQVAYKLEQDLAMWDPGTDPNATGSDPYKTLFIGRINYDTSESKLRREFEVYGPLRKVHVVHNQRSGKPRGFAFIEYEHERDMHSAYKHADGKKIDGRRVLVDVERGRTIKGWRPRRLGGGLGGTRKGGPEVNTKYSGRDDMMRERSRTPEPEDRMRRRREERSRSRERPPRRERERERSRSRERERPRRPRRSRSRERRRRSRSKEKTEEKTEEKDIGDEISERKRSRRSRSPRPERPERADRRRSRSRDRDRKRRRSRSRERIKRERVDRNERSGGGGENGAAPSEFDPSQVVVKPEPPMVGEYGGGTYTQEPTQPNGQAQNPYEQQQTNEYGSSYPIDS